MEDRKRILKAHAKCIKDSKEAQRTWNYNRWAPPLTLIGEEEKRKQMKFEREKAEKLSQKAERIEPTSEFENRKRRLLPSSEDKTNHFHDYGLWSILPQSFDDVFVERNFQPYQQIPENSGKTEEEAANEKR